MNLIPTPPGKPAYILPDDEIAARFWRSVWGGIAVAECHPDDPAGQRRRDPLVTTLIGAFLDAPVAAGGLHSLYALDDIIGARAMRAAIMAVWPQVVEAT